MGSLLAAVRLVFVLLALGFSQLDEKLDKDDVNMDSDCTVSTPALAKGASLLQSRRAKHPPTAGSSVPTVEIVPATEHAPATQAAAPGESLKHATAAAAPLVHGPDARGRTLANLTAPHQQVKGTTWPPMIMPQANDVANSSTAVRENLKTLQQESSADTMPSLATALFSLMPVSLSLAAFAFILTVVHHLLGQEAAEDSSLRPIAITGSIEGPAPQGKPPKKEPQAAARERSSSVSAYAKAADPTSPEKANSPRAAPENLTHSEDADVAAGAPSAENSEWMSAEGDPEP